MNLIDAVNLIMPKLGERPVTSLDLKHPTLAILLPIIDKTKRQLLAKGWWFNQFEYTAYPNSDGEIYLSKDALSFVPYDSNAILRDRRLYNADNMTFVFEGPVNGTLIVDLPFEALPEVAANYCIYMSCVEAVATDIGVVQEVQVWQSKAAMAYSDLLQEHMRQKKYTTKKTGTWLRIKRAMYG